jgi:hypothetical protein
MKVASAAAGRVSGGIARYTGKQVAKGGRLLGQRLNTRKDGTTRTDSLRTLNLGLKKWQPEGRLGKATKAVANAVPSVLNKGASNLARGVDNISTNEEYVKQAQKSAPKNWETAEKNLKGGGLSVEEQFANLAVLIKEGKLKEQTQVGNKTAAQFLGDTDLISRYGQEKLAGDADKVLMSTVTSRRADAVITQAQKKQAEGGVVTKEDLMVEVAKDIKDEDGKVIYKKGEKAGAVGVKQRAEAEQLFNMPKADASKVNVNELFGANTALAEFENRVKNIATYAPQIVPNLMKGMKGPAMKRFSTAYGSQIESLVKTYKEEMDSATEDSKRATATFKHERAKKAKVGFDRAYSSVFGTAEAEKGGAGGGEEKKSEEKH